MSLSVLTIVRNRSEHLKNLIKGVRRSRLQPCEIVVVDMSDPPIDLGEQPDLRIERLACEGLVLARARNRAATCARGEKLVFLDVDCIPMQDCLGLLDAALDAEDALLCAEVRYLGPGDCADDWTEAGLLANGRRHPARSFPDEGLQKVDDPGLFWSLGFAIRRETFFGMGGFDESFVGYGAEDTDFGFAADASGLPLLFLGGAIVCHQFHESYDPPVQHVVEIVANARRFHAKWGIWPMDGWLRKFRSLGLIEWSKDHIAMIRAPTIAEREQARVFSNV